MISCPSERRFTIILTDLIHNNSIDQVANDKEEGITRKLVVENVQVALINRSLEKFDPLYRDATIIVTKNETALAESG